MDDAPETADAPRADGVPERAAAPEPDTVPDTGGDRSGIRALLGLQAWLPSRLALLVIAALGLAGGLLEAFVLGLVAAAGGTLAQGEATLALGLGPVDVDTTVGRAIAVGFAATAAMVGTRLVASHLGAKLSADTLITCRARLLSDYLSASYEVQRATLQAELHDLVTFQAMRMAQSALMVAVAATNALAFVAMVAVALLFDPVTGGALLGASVVLAAVFLPLVRRSNRAGSSHLSSQLQVGVDLGDVSGLLAETQVYGAKDGMLDRAGRSVSAAGRAFRSASWAAQITPTLYMGVVLAILLSGLAVLNIAGVTDLTTLGAIVLLTLRGLRYSQQAQSNVQVAVELAPNIASVTDASEAFRAAAVDDEGAPLERIDELGFAGVGYRHPGTDEGIRDVTLTLRRGEVVGVVGHSGAGKSTFAEVTLGLRAPTSGQVLVNGRPRDDFSARAWFDRVAYVGQESRLLVGTVAANVAFFRDLDAATIDRALDAASLRDDLARWEDGVERDVGAGGRDVSGGQRQRIAIARALAGDPDVVVMDEPTSALDPGSEQQIRRSIAALAGEVLVIVVAHRRSTLEACDRILRFEEGRVTEVSPDAVDELPV